MIGERSGHVFQLAGRIRVKVARVDLETAKIDFTLADDDAAAAGVVSETKREYSAPLARSDGRPRGPKLRH
jgi:ribonuclease R